MIRRFSENIDWKKDSSRSEAEDLYRRILVEYVRDYLSHGDEALMEYEGKKKTVSLKAEQNSLKQNIFWLKRFSPELDSYLSDFPNSGREDITNTFRWSKIKFGLKPVVIISHTATYKEQDGDTSQIIIISKQIYSSRYIDSSLGFTALVSFPKEDGNFETYIIFANYSRASALASRLGGLARGLVEKEAKGKLKNILGDTRRGAALLIANQANSPETYHPAGYRELFTRNAGIIFGVSIFVLVVIVVIRNRRG